MPFYTFYPSCPEGPTLPLKQAQLANDADAIAYARHLLEWHPSAKLVDVWDGDRDVSTVRRPQGPA